MLWRETESTPRTLASNTFDSTGDCDVSAEGDWAVYETKTTYNIELISTSDNSTAQVINQVSDSGERASDPAISGEGKFVAYGARTYTT